MTEIEESKLIASLHDVIESWWDKNCESIENAPWIGEKTFYLMARNAISIFLASNDTEIQIEENT